MKQFSVKELELIYRVLDMAYDHCVFLRADEEDLRKIVLELRSFVEKENAITPTPRHA